MAIAADFERVYKIGPPYYHKAVDLLDQLWLSIFKGLRSLSGPEIQTIKSQHHLDDFCFLATTLRLSHTEAVQILINNMIDSRSVNPNIHQLPKYNVDHLFQTSDYYIINKFLLVIRPFYTMPDPVEPIRAFRF
ncbi:hypothetical protein PtB15_3B632 [Puccinia triticina]|nr:hypothetical protein PtB15_3B632 [Puccinia triticina]